MTARTWRISPDAAYVDDGARIVAVSLTDPAAARPQVLEGTAATIWRIVGSGPEDEVIRIVADHYGVEPTAVEADVRFFLLRLEEEGLAQRTT